MVYQAEPGSTEVGRLHSTGPDGVDSVAEIIVELAQTAGGLRDATSH